MRAWIAAVVLTWAALWPLGHRALVAAYDVNPWKLGGFAMYTTATPPVVVVAFEQRNGSLAPIDPATLSAEARDALQAFQIRRHALGRLVLPDALAEAVFDARPQLAHLLIAVQRMKLDPGTARMTSTRDSYVYDRGAPTAR